jgi:hypothetical protein
LGALAQLGERRLCKPKVTGSIPVRSIIKRPRKRGLSVCLTEDAGRFDGRPDATPAVVEPDGEITLIEVTFHDDGSRWRTNVATSHSDQAELKRLVQSLWTRGEFESAFDPADTV